MRIDRVTEKYVTNQNKTLAKNTLKGIAERPKIFALKSAVILVPSKSWILNIMKAKIFFNEFNLVFRLRPEHLRRHRGRGWQEQQWANIHFIDDRRGSKPNLVQVSRLFRLSLFAIDEEGE